MQTHQLDITTLLTHLITSLPAAIAVLIGAVAVHFIAGRGLRLLAEKSDLTPEDIAPLHRAVRWLIVGATLVVLLGIFGFNLGGLWAVFSTIFALVAIGFVAMWSVLSNTLCTLIILIFRPFAVGDEIEFAGEPVRGRVIDLNFIYTSVQCEDGSTMQIPNNLFFQKVLKRRHGQGGISLAAQLNAREPTR
jgi:small-conductance mechanosensitive channel